MDIFDNIYHKSLSENERNLRFWEDYLKNLKELDLNIFSEKLKLPVLVPAGSRIMFRGELKHTNEVTVALGANYFVKCSTSQAEVLRQHRIKDAETKVDALLKEKAYLSKHLSFTKDQIFDKKGQEIMEPFNEEDDKVWRKQHKENMRKYKQQKVKPESGMNITDEDLWERLEELELQEDIENEMERMGFHERSLNNNNESTNDESTSEEIKNDQIAYTLDAKVSENDTAACNKNDKSDFIWQKVLDKQSELEQKLTDLKNEHKKETRTEHDILSRLEELEAIEEIESEMDRLDDVLNTGDTEEPDTNKPRRSVSFADDDDDAETLQIEFRHSDIEPGHDPYDSEKGVTKPSDIYEAFPNAYLKQTSSILKKSKYVDRAFKEAIRPIELSQIEEENDEHSDQEEQRDRTIVIKDVVENPTSVESKLEGSNRPPSLFKMRRQQRK